MNNLESLLVKHEGLRLRPYRCTAGKLTIGVGRNLEDNGITPEEAMTMLRNDLGWVNGALDNDVPWWKGLDPVRQSILQSMVFNMGAPRFLGFSKAITAMQQGDWEYAAIEMLDSLWARQVGTRANELAEMMKTGEWPTGL